MLLAAILISPLLYRSFTLPFPTDSDQDEYLREARVVAEQFRFPSARQLYSSWLAVFDKISWRRPATALLSRKDCICAPVGLSSRCPGLASVRCENWIPAAFLVAELQILLTEPNGSHALAASMLAASLLCLYLPWRAAALPASLFILLLSIKETWESGRQNPIDWYQTNGAWIERACGGEFYARQFESGVAVP